MKRKRFIEEQIISILEENETGISVPDLACRHGFAEALDPPTNQEEAITTFKPVCHLGE